MKFPVEVDSNLTQFQGEILKNSYQYIFHYFQHSRRKFIYLGLMCYYTSSKIITPLYESVLLSLCSW